MFAWYLDTFTKIGQDTGMLVGCFLPRMSLNCEWWLLVLDACLAPFYVFLFYCGWLDATYKWKIEKILTAKYLRIAVLAIGFWIYIFLILLIPKVTLMVWNINTENGEEPPPKEVTETLPICQ